MVSFRQTTSREDQVLARILYNAFHDRWEMNWWQSLAAPVGKIASPPVQDEYLSPSKTARLNFYLTFLKCIRDAGGLVEVAVPPDSEQPVAVSCWLPPNIRPSLFAFARAGFVTAMLRFGGLIGFYRLWSYEHLATKLFARNIQHGAFVRILGTDPAYSGNRYAEQLLKWQVERHEKLFPSVPVFIETNSDYAQKIYERIGFREIGRQVVVTGTDENGFQLREKLGRERVENINNGHVSTAMVYENK